MTTQLKSSNLANNISVNIGSSGALTTTNFTMQESGGKLNIHPNSVLFKRLPPLVVYGQRIETTKKFLKFVTWIESDWLIEIHPKLYKYSKK